MTTDTQKQFSIAEKEEIVAELREKYARAKHDLTIAQLTVDEALRERDRLHEIYFDAKNDYERADAALIEEMSSRAEEEPPPLCATCWQVPGSMFHDKRNVSGHTFNPAPRQAP